MKVYIRNMACESCKVIVKEALTKLKLHPVKVELGEAEVKTRLKGNQIEKFNNEIKKAGLEVVENPDVILIEKIKKCVLEYIKSPRKPKQNFSDYLSAQLKYDYGYLSALFSDIQATTITQFMNSVKTELIKEKILFEDLSLSQIAEKMHYNNLSHFSAQFKKISGLSPSHFKKLKDKRRRSMQELSIGKN